MENKDFRHIFKIPVTSINLMNLKPEIREAISIILRITPTIGVIIIDEPLKLKYFNLIETPNNYQIAGVKDDELYLVWKEE